MIKQWLVLAIFLGVCGSSRILVFYPGPSGSLLLSFRQLFQELSRRGHELTIMSAYHQAWVEEYNITQLVFGRNFTGEVLKNYASRSLVPQIHYALGLAIKDCENLFKYPQMKDILTSYKKYDLFIGSPFYFLECSIAVAHHLKLPVLNIYSNRMPIHVAHLSGNLYPYSYVTEFQLPFSNNMNFWQKIANVMFCFGYSLALSLYYLPQMSAIVKQNFPHLPPLQEMLTQIPVTLLNTNIALHPVQPYPPGIIPVGGLTVPPEVKLPQDLKTWMDNSPDGVILFSLGSNRKVSLLDPEILKTTLEVFSKLPQRVLMKWELDQLDGKPENVRIAKWIPQPAVLAHKHCRLFITHGGLHSWMEAVTYAVPLLGVQPTFFDQFHNLAEMQERGQGLYFNEPWTTDNFQRAVDELLHNPRYKENMRKASKVFWDQPMTPLQTAVYWTEYVIRHDGARHLQSTANSMPWYQLVLLDVVGAILLCVVAALLLLRAALRLFNYEYIIFPRKRNKLKRN